MRPRRPEDVIAAINGAIVLLVPVIVALAFLFRRAGMDAPVRPPGNYVLKDFVLSVAVLEVPLAPFAVVAGWRTWVRVHRWRSTGLRDFWGVLEGAATGLVAAVLVLMPGIATRPFEAAPYIITYGAIGACVGLAFGILLQVTAMLALSFVDRARPADA